MSDYFDALAASLRRRGVEPEAVRATIDDLTAYLDESGTGPRSEFGPVEEFAERLTTGMDEDTPPPEGGESTWRWAADTFCAPRRLNEFGAQGWEVERVDRLGRFVSRRDPDHPQRWEYRQEIADTGKRREELAARLAPEGWEVCGHWSVFTYLKRPEAASAGPAARVEPVPATPGRSYFLGRWGAVWIAGALAVIVAAAVSLVGDLREEPGGDLATWVGVAVGAVVGAAVALLALWMVARLYSRWRERAR